jgi:peptidyl-dipeptidase A
VKFRQLAKYSNELRSIYAKARVVVDGQTLSLEPGLTKLMKSSRNYTKLKRAWVGWHRESGGRMRHIFTNTVRLSNKAARESGYADLSENWIEEFEDDELESSMDSLLSELKPLYEQLHAYARRRLENVYGREYPVHHKPTLIPAHLFGILTQLI